MSEEILVKYPTAYGDAAFNLTRPHIVIALSGGFDSAVTLYGIAQAIRDHGTGNEIHPITVRKISNQKRKLANDKANPFPIVKNLVKWMREQFPTVVIHDVVQGHVIDWWEDEYKYTQKQRDLINKIAAQYGPENTTMFMGMTMNPPVVIGQEKHIAEDGKEYIGNADLARDSITEPVIPGTISSWSQCDGVIECFPFRNFDKRAVYSFADIYYGSHETFLNMTRSCEGFRRNTQNFTSTCGAGPEELDKKCWWCHEREWTTEHYAIDKENGFHP